MLDKILNFEKLGGDYAEMLTAVRKKVPCSVFGMSQTERILSATALKKVLYITSDLVTAKRVHEYFVQLVGNRACLLPSGSDILTYKKAQSNQDNVDRIKAIFSLVQDKSAIVIAPVEAIFSYLPSRDSFEKNIFKIEKNENYQLKNLASTLTTMGYTRESLVTEPGHFSVRGDIIDIFPINHKFPYRVDFFDIEVESIRIFDVVTQASSEEIDYIDICPYTNLFIDEVDEKNIVSALRDLESKSNFSADARARFGAIVDEIAYKLSIKDRSFSMDFVFPLIRHRLSSILDYLDKDTTIVIDETKMVFDALSSSFSEIEHRQKYLSDTGESIPTKLLGYYNKKDFLRDILDFNLLAFQKITTSNRLFQPEKVFSFKTSPVVRYTHNLNEFANDVSTWLFNDFKVFICAGDTKGAKKIGRILEGHEIYIDEKKHASLGDNSSCIIPYELTSGFVLPTRRIVVIGTYDIFPRKQKTNKLLTQRKDVFSVPKVGDYVVHEVHGIGLCEGVTKLTGNFGTKDYIVVGYRDQDKLYVPIEQMDLLDRFSGADTPKRLSKIGGSEFSAVKERVKKHIKKMAFDLLELYAKRESKKGFVFEKDDELQLEFENSFPYTETEDQLISISEIKNDMQSDKVMDRLLCGDVGFGKTEVALRAAFKAVLSGKQVAFLAPTTILSEQHYNTCVDRFKEFGLTIGVLNRFRTQSEKNKILSDLESGKLNIICGTHRLLSKDVKFFDLGLIILDEEQKFGVEDKEKIKLGKSNVDVLTLSATPIPRTLHMSLSGIRDISIISTPPSDRLPVQTYVTEYTDNIAKDAIECELMRGGQVFLVYNRVETINAFKEKIQKLVPNAKIVVGHGQLPGNELEDIVYKFYNKMADVLVCTTIIENGIDLPNANTLIVVDSDKFGLSQLYQIRGRVGRGNRMAYAYFTYNADKILTEESYKRLDAIAEFTEFGSGFKVAMRDLEIRGSGNILGAEQHGHMQKVGYDLYVKMLNNTINELKGNKLQQASEVVIKVSLDAFIPESYIADSENRMTVYKNISRIENFEDMDKLSNELEDRFGKVPQMLQNLLEIAYVKSLAKNIGCTEVTSNSNGIRLVFAENNNIINNERLADAIYKYSDICVLNLSSVPTITINTMGKKNTESFKILVDFLNIANKKPKK